MIIFNEPLLLGTEKIFLDQVFKNGYFCGDGVFSQKCEKTLADLFQAKKVLLTSSGSSALCIASELLDINPGDEIILPPFAHVGTASAFARQKARLIWCDIKASTRNLDEHKLEKLISPKSKAVVTVNYAGISDNIAVIKEICRKHSLILIEDNAHGIAAYYRDLPLGSFGDLAITSFHQTKNIHCGEGGALIINSPHFMERAQKIRDRGTDRKDFNDGKIDYWSWWKNGSNYYLSELQAAFLYAQLLELKNVNLKRQKLFYCYIKKLKENLPKRSLPVVEKSCQPNGHCFSILTESETHRKNIINKLHQMDIQSAFHYLPLHKAPYWNRLYENLKLPVAEMVADTILRLPMHYNLSSDDVEKCCAELTKAFISEKK
jgi:dTDP-4-amino-4,6-dideoxygalactose transaminase